MKKNKLRYLLDNLPSVATKFGAAGHIVRRLLQVEFDYIKFAVGAPFSQYDLENILSSRAHNLPP